MPTKLIPGRGLHARAIKHVESMFKLAQEQRKPLETIWTQLNDGFIAYERNSRLAQNEARQDVIYLIYHFVETIAAFIVDNMLPEEDFGSMKPIGQEDKLSAGPINKLLQWRMDKARVREKLIRIIVRALVYGISWAKIPWTERTRTIYAPTTDIDAETGLEVEGMELQDFLAYSGPDLLCKNIWDVWYDRYMEDLDEGWVFDRDRMTVGEIRTMKDVADWQNVDSFLRKVKSEMTSEDVEEREDDDNQTRFDLAEHMPGGGSYREGRQITGKNRVDIFEYWGPFDLEGDGNYVPCMINFNLDKRTVFRVEPIPYWHGQLPWIACRPMPWLEEFTGMSVAGVNLGKQNYLNDVFKLILENWERAINQIIFKNQDAKVNTKQLRFQAYRMYDVQVPYGSRMDQVIHFPNTADIKASSLAILNHIQDGAQRESSVEDFFSTGQTRGVTKTASGIAQITERAGSRHKFKLSIIENQTIRRVGYQFFALDQQFARDEDVTPVIEGELPRLPVESIIRWWDFVPIGTATLLNKQADRENLAFLFQTVTNAVEPMLATGHMIDFKLLFDGIAKKIDMPEFAEAVKFVGMPQPQIPGEEDPLAAATGIAAGGNGELPPEGMGGM